MLFRCKIPKTRYVFLCLSQGILHWLTSRMCVLTVSYEGNVLELQPVNFEMLSFIPVTYP